MDEDFLNKKIEFRKLINSYQGTKTIKDCFYHDKAECKGIIKKAHSIQRNGRLSLIESDLNGNKMLYTFTEFENDSYRMIKTLKPIGKGSASTFSGFCSHHDDTLFKTIESKPFDNSTEHLFLHSYRSFAHSYHRMQENLKAYGTDSLFTKSFNQDLLKSDLNTLKLELKNALYFKRQLDSFISNKDYKGLTYFSLILSEFYPIACSSQIMPIFSYNNRVMEFSRKGKLFYSSLMLTILPDLKGTIIILASFPNDKSGLLFLKELKQLKKDDQLKIISSLIINCTENTLFSPQLWNALGEKGQQQLCQELNYTYINNPIIGFRHSKINFFDSEYQFNNSI